MPVPDITKQMPVPAFLMHSSFLRLAAYRPLTGILVLRCQDMEVIMATILEVSGPLRGLWF